MDRYETARKSDSFLLLLQILIPWLPNVPPALCQPMCSSDAAHQPPCQTHPSLLASPPPPLLTHPVSKQLLSSHQSAPVSSSTSSPYSATSGLCSYPAMNGYSYPSPPYPVGSAGTPACSPQLNTSHSNAAGTGPAPSVSCQPLGQANAAVMSAGAGAQSGSQLPSSGGYMNSMNNSQASVSCLDADSQALSAAAGNISQPSASSGCMDAGLSNSFHPSPTDCAISAPARNDQQPCPHSCSINTGAINNLPYPASNINMDVLNYTQGSDSCMNAGAMDDQQMAADVLCHLQNGEDQVSPETPTFHPSCSHTGTPHSASFLSSSTMSARAGRSEPSSASYNHTLQQGLSVKLETNCYHVLSTVDIPNSDKVLQTRQDHPSLPPYNVFLSRSAFLTRLPGNAGQAGCMMGDGSVMLPPPSLANTSSETRLQHNTSGSQHTNSQAAFHRYVLHFYLQIGTKLQPSNSASQVCIILLSTNQHSASTFTFLFTCMYCTSSDKSTPSFNPQIPLHWYVLYFYLQIYTVLQPSSSYS